MLANVLTSGFSLIIRLPASDVQRTTGHWVGEFLDYPVLLYVSLFFCRALPRRAPRSLFLLDVPEVDESGLLWPARGGTFRILVANAVTQKSPIPRVEVATIIQIHVAYLE